MEYKIKEVELNGQKYKYLVDLFPEFNDDGSMEIAEYDSKFCVVKYDKEFNLLIDANYMNISLVRLFLIDREYDAPFWGLDHYSGPLDTVVDLGAHIGTFSLSAIKRGARRVFSYEACFETFLNLSFNALVNNLKGKIVPHNYAILDRSFDIANLNRIDLDFGQSPAQNSLYGIIDNIKTTEQVMTLSLSDLLKPLDEVSYLKIDTEGAEYTYLTRDIESSLRKVRAIDIEPHGEPFNPMALYDLLETFKFRRENQRVWVNSDFKK